MELVIPSDGSEFQIWEGRGLLKLPWVVSASRTRLLLVKCQRNMARQHKECSAVYVRQPLGTSHNGGQRPSGLKSQGGTWTRTTADGTQKGAALLRTLTVDERGQSGRLNRKRYRPSVSQSYKLSAAHEEKH